MSEETAAAREPLQFEQLESSVPDRPMACSPQGVQCAFCSAAVESEYFQVNGVAACPRCRETLACELAEPPGWNRFAVASLFGLGAAVAGAIIYYAVIALLNLEIGIVAILIGYMVGYSVRKGAGGRGARRYQVLAVVLTYWAVGLAYSPLAFTELSQKNAATASADSSQASAAPAEGGGSSIVTALAFLSAFIFALPVLMVIGSLPAGLISAFIIALGIRQAWRMTAAVSLDVSGPYKIGATRSALPA